MAGYGFSITPMSGIPYEDFIQLAREAEDAGFAGIYVPESNNDVLMCCYAIARATKRVKVASWIANIFLRDPTLCAAAADMVQDASDGRFILGLGVSHRPALEARGIEMINGRDRLKRDAMIIRKAWGGEPLGEGSTRFRKPKHPIPLYFAALTLQTARLGGEMGDGLMLHFSTPERMRKGIDAARDAAVKAGRKPADVAITMGMKTFLDNDLGRAYDAARRNIATYAMLPFYNRVMALSGFEREAKAIEEAGKRHDRPAMLALISEKMCDSLTLVGPASRCIERIAQYRENGAETPIIVPTTDQPDYADYIRRNIKGFARLN